MNPGADGVGIAAACVAGLAGSAHCLAMCGGIAGALGVRADGRADRWAPLRYNLARIASYSVAGALAGGAGGVLLQAFDVQRLSTVLRLVAGLVMLAAAARLLFGWRLLDPLESLGGRAWRRLVPAGRLASSRSAVLRSVGLGLAWGALPCAMTYSMLLLAATTASTAAGAALMLAFGIGTLPSMLGAGLLLRGAGRRWGGPGNWQRIAGALLLAFGLWTAGSAVWHARSGTMGHDHHHQHHAEAGSASGAAGAVGVETGT
jgi:sulfite exporter TauE/SafE